MSYWECSHGPPSHILLWPLTYLSSHLAERDFMHAPRHGSECYFIAKITDWAVPLQRGFFIFDSKPFSCNSTPNLDPTFCWCFTVARRQHPTTVSSITEFNASVLLSVFEREVCNFWLMLNAYQGVVDVPLVNSKRHWTPWWSFLRWHAGPKACIVHTQLGLNMIWVLVFCHNRYNVSRRVVTDGGRDGISCHCCFRSSRRRCICMWCWAAGRRGLSEWSVIAVYFSYSLLTQTPLVRLLGDMLDPELASRYPSQPLS